METQNEEIKMERIVDLLKKSKENETFLILFITYMC